MDGRVDEQKPLLTSRGRVDRVDSELKAGESSTSCKWGRGLPLKAGRGTPVGIGARAVYGSGEFLGSGSL